MNHVSLVRTSAKRAFLLLLSLLLALSLFSCGAEESLPGGDQAPQSGVQGDGNTTPSDEAPADETPDENTPDGDTPDGDTPDGDTPDGDTPDGNTPDDTPDEGGSGTGACTHQTRTVKGKVAATCTKDGYTGDTYCAKCGVKLESGKTTAATGHKNTEVRGKVAATQSSTGYTGDTYCADCGTLLFKGSTVPKLGAYTFTLKDGEVVSVDYDWEIRAYSMKKYTKTVSSRPSRALEEAILTEVNRERAAEGLSSLSFYNDAYYFTKIRAEEAQSTWSHTRPNGKSWSSVYTDAGVILYGSWAENLFACEGSGYLSMDTATLAKTIVSSWMGSEGHRANILGRDFTHVAIACCTVGNKMTVAQNFFGT